MQHYKNFEGTIFKLKNIYEKLLINPDEEVKGNKLRTCSMNDVFTMTGFLDGINESLNKRIN